MNLDEAKATVKNEKATAEQLAAAGRAFTRERARKATKRKAVQKRRALDRIRHASRRANR